VARHWMHTELQDELALVFVSDEPRLRSVDVAVDRGAELFVQREDELARNPPHRRRSTAHQAVDRSELPPLRSHRCRNTTACRRSTPASSTWKGSRPRCTSAR